MGTKKYFNIRLKTCGGHSVVLRMHILRLLAMECIKGLSKLILHLLNFLFVLFLLSIVLEFFLLKHLLLLLELLLLQKLSEFIKVKVDGQELSIELVTVFLEFDVD